MKLLNKQRFIRDQSFLNRYYFVQTSTNAQKVQIRVLQEAEHTALIQLALFRAKRIPARAHQERWTTTAVEIVAPLEMVSLIQPT